MLRYLVGLQGNQRTLVLNRANDLMKENEPIQDESEYHRTSLSTPLLSTFTGSNVQHIMCICLHVPILYFCSEQCQVDL